MVEVRSLAECSFSEALKVWNIGFQDYQVDVQMTMERFLKRIVSEELCPQLSVSAYIDNRPAGIVLSGIRNIKEKRIAWNGGTAVAPLLRGQRIGDALLAYLLDRYRIEGVDVARLEAIHTNKRAIQLYEKWGYEIFEELHYMSGHDLHAQLKNWGFEIEDSNPQQISLLPFYRSDVQWQTQWQSVQDGKALIVYDEEEPVGYALYKEKLDNNGEVGAIYLYQCEAAPAIDHERNILASLLHGVFQTKKAGTKLFAVNISDQRKTLIDLLHKSGFSTVLKQVHMEKKL
ncbi:GNAT family N-acetyltransferase [Bacillus tianshenii]|nr:GNAT family N-acetyltransferase [Bacillus tianshenii]